MFPIRHCINSLWKKRILWNYSALLKPRKIPLADECYRLIILRGLGRFTISIKILMFRMEEQSSFLPLIKRSCLLLMPLATQSIKAFSFNLASLVVNMYGTSSAFALCAELGKYSENEKLLKTRKLLKGERIWKLIPFTWISQECKIWMDVWGFFGGVPAWLGFAKTEIFQCWARPKNNVKGR